jgi:hypothetical protein
MASEVASMEPVVICATWPMRRDLPGRGANRFGQCGLC